MYILHTVLLASAITALAAPSGSSRCLLDDVEIRDLEYPNKLEHRGLHYNNLKLIMRDFVEFSEILEARTGPFANLDKSSAEKTKAKIFLNGATHAQLENAAASSTSAATVYEKDRFHLDRQQPSSARFKSKVAVQYNKVDKGKPSTIGQVVIPHGVNPKPDHVRNELKESIDRGEERIVKETRKAKNIDKYNKRRVRKAANIAKKMAEGEARAKKGIFKKGNGKPSAKFTPLPPKWRKA